MKTLLDIFSEEIKNEPNLIEKIIDKKMESQNYLYRCLDIMKADPNLSEDTKIIMFIEYARLINEEQKPKNVKVICSRCGTINVRKMD
jgi:hypothetical protein